jgi:hypothetical protein
MSYGIYMHLPKSLGGTRSNFNGMCDIKASIILHTEREGAHASKQVKSLQLVRLHEVPLDAKFRAILLKTLLVTKPPRFDCVTAYWDARAGDTFEPVWPKACRRCRVRHVENVWWQVVIRGRFGDGRYFCFVNDVDFAQGPVIWDCRGATSRNQVMLHPLISI